MSLGQVIADDIADVANDDLAGPQEFEKALARTLPAIASIASSGSARNVVLKGVEDIGRALVQAVYFEVWSKTRRDDRDAGTGGAVGSYRRANPAGAALHRLRPGSCVMKQHLSVAVLTTLGIAVSPAQAEFANVSKTPITCAGPTDVLP